ELGPGRGTLMQDALRAASRAPGFTDALHLQLFESNPDLRALQAERLAAYSPYWAPEIDAVSDDPLFVVANEFFDALPIHQFVRGPEGWHERQVGLRDDRRTFGLSPAPIPDHVLPEAVRDAEPGPGETLQAVSRHASADPLEAPGAADLSAHVDFAALGRVAAAAGLTVQPLTPQGTFLRRLGIAERAEMLARANPGEANDI